MARLRQTLALDIFLNAKPVGRLRREASGAIDFTYAQSWLDWPHALPVSLSLPLREDRYIGEPVSIFFDNLLPDNMEIRKHVAERVGAGGIEAFDLLAALGRECVGALQFLPEGVEPGPAGMIAGVAVGDEEIAAIIRNLSRNPLGLDANADFRISIAGAQEKTALLRSQGQWLRPTGTTPTTHIFKPQIGQLPNGLDLSNSVENEYLCLMLTRAFGIPTAAVEMATFGDRRVLIVERFDRILTMDGRLLRVPQEDCCQALAVPWTRKYEKDQGPGIQRILSLLAGSDLAAVDQRHFLKAQIIFWLLAATDGHAKNFSIFLSPGGGYRLTPLYDVISAQPSLPAHQLHHNKMKLAMSVGNNRHYVVDEIAARHFVQSAEKAGIGKKVTIEVIDDVLSVVPHATQTVIDGLPTDFPPAIVEAVAHGIASRLVQLEARV
jgi:serine/threonine-protein kinase HipA